MSRVHLTIHLIIRFFVVVVAVVAIIIIISSSSSSSIARSVAFLLGRLVVKTRGTIFSNSEGNIMNRAFLVVLVVTTRGRGVQNRKHGPCRLCSGASLPNIIECATATGQVAHLEVVATVPTKPPMIAMEH